jgi:hypothetical protein
VPHLTTHCGDQRMYEKRLAWIGSRTAVHSAWIRRTWLILRFEICAQNVCPQKQGLLSGSDRTAQTASFRPYGLTIQKSSCNISNPQLHKTDSSAIFTRDCTKQPSSLRHCEITTPNLRGSHIRRLAKLCPRDSGFYCTR